MAKTLTAGKAAGARTKQDKRAYAQLGHNTWRKAFMQHYWLYILMIPGILYMLIFNYTPMAGLVMAFEDFSPYNGDTAIQALFGSPFAGLKYFEKLFTGPDFWRLLRNTLAISLANLIFAFPAPIILALLLNELRCKWFKRFSQTLVYIPHFVSIVIVAALTYQLFSTTDGVAYHMLVQVFGKQNAPDIMSDPKLFSTMIVGQNLWKETGYGTIIYLAALSSVDTQLYEAAKIDGAGRWQLMARHAARHPRHHHPDAHHEGRLAAEHRLRTDLPDAERHEPLGLRRVRHLHLHQRHRQRTVFPCHGCRPVQVHRQYGHGRRREQDRQAVR